MSVDTEIVRAFSATEKWEQERLTAGGVMPVLGRPDIGRSSRDLCFSSVVDVAEDEMYQAGTEVVGSGNAGHALLDCAPFAA